jgi:hypothetical protein
LTFGNTSVKLCVNQVIQLEEVMETNKIPTEIQKWLDNNPEMIDEYFMERDEWGRDDGLGDWSIWLYLERGYINTNCEMHIIHECTVEDFFDNVAFIEECDCEDCEEE